MFKLTPGGSLTTLASFNGSNVESPAAGLVQGTDGNFYGTSFFGTQDGTVFQVTPSGSVTVLHNFNQNDGRFAQSKLLQGSDGNFYGTTSEGGPYDDGTVFKITPSGSLTTLVNFDGTLGNGPRAGLIADKAGNFYGTTSVGPTNKSGDGGEVFKVNPSGSLTVMGTFTGINGFAPQSSLVLGSDGNFYGTTSAGGSSYVDPSNTGYGTIFRMTPDGAITTLVNFNNTNGRAPYSELIQAKDGNFYGTTVSGGTADKGTIFQMTPSGSLTTLLQFNGDNGAFPRGIVQGSDGDFYGATQPLDSSEHGTLFKLSLTTPAPTTDGFGGVLLGDNYYYSSWFGIYNSQFYPWDYRTDIGFFYVDPVGTDLYLYVVKGNPAPMGWLYTNSTIFPNVYSFTKASFLYFFDGTNTFGNYTTGKIETY